ncbi:endo-1,4-beta-xylanase [Micromonospora sonneratiae]|uniref:Beta-xylanase n=1 Tax=Micromonospora sonneratiae TaxID=1184706 RepID=A0ABW3YBG5_9ACTN
MPDWPALRSLMPSNVRIGTAVDGRVLATDARYRAVLGRDFNAATAENAMKWSQLQPTPGTYVWQVSDDLVAFAEENGLAMYGHTLVWHSSVPSWVSESWSAEELGELLRQHVTAVVSRYRGKIWAWDVVNEVLDEDGSLRDTIWLRKLGPDYIADAFRWAHAADPDARLFINDYGTEGRTRKADGLLRLVSKLRASGVPIHGVGFQSHLQWDKAPVEVAGNLRRFADRGLSVAITELDVRIQLPVTPERLARQAMLYEQMLAACLAVSTCESFTLWGFTDARSWIPYNYPGYGAACLFDSEMKPKLAHSALVDALREDRTGAPGG